MKPNKTINLYRVGVTAELVEAPSKAEAARLSGSEITDMRFVERLGQRTLGQVTARLTQINAAWAGYMHRLVVRERPKAKRGDRAATRASPLDRVKERKAS